MSARRLLPLILLAGLAARLGYGWLRPPQPRGAPLYDPDHYLMLGASFAETGSFRDTLGQPSAEREPVYPALVGAAFKVLGRRYATVLLLNSALSVAAVWLLFAVGCRLVGERAALRAALVGALYPPFLFYSAQPLRECMMSLAAVAVVAAALRAHEARTWGSAAAAGAVAALAALVNTTFLPYCGLAPALLFLLGRSRQALARAAVFAAVAAVTYAPWPLRNYRMFHQLVIGSTAGAGSTFYAYLVVPQEVGGTDKQVEILSADPVAQKANTMDRPSGERYFWREGLKRVQQAPMTYARLVLWRFLWDFWRVVPRERNYGASYRLIKVVSLATDGWIIPLGFLGLTLALARSREALYPAAFMAGFAGVYALIFTMIRYRFALMPWLILFSACAVDSLRHSRRSAGSAGS